MVTKSSATDKTVKKIGKTKNQDFLYMFFFIQWGTVSIVDNHKEKVDKIKHGNN